MSATAVAPVKPKVILLSYATRNFRLSQLLLGLSAKIFGVDSCILRTRKELERTDFYKEYKHILDEKRGGGFWLWKPYFIYDTLSGMNENDILLYVDAGTILRRNLKYLIKLVSKNNPVALFLNDAPQYQFTKRDIFISLNCDDPVYYNAPMVHANIQLYLNCAIARNFVKNVLDYCCIDRLVTDDENQLGKSNIKGFEVNMGDQSVLSAFALNEGLTFQLDPTQFRTSNRVYNISKGIHDPDYPVFPACFFVHRYTNKRLLLLTKYLLPKYLRRRLK